VTPSSAPSPSRRCSQVSTTATFILYRQQALDDAVKHPDAVRAPYDLAVETLQEEKKIWSWHGYTRR